MGATLSFTKRCLIASLTSILYLVFIDVFMLFYEQGSSSEVVDQGAFARTSITHNENALAIMLHFRKLLVNKQTELGDVGREFLNIGVTL